MTDENIIAGVLAVVLLFVIYRLFKIWKRARSKDSYATMRDSSTLPREGVFARFHRSDGNDVFNFDVLDAHLDYENGRKSGARLTMSFPVRAASGAEADALLAARDPENEGNPRSHGHIDSPQSWDNPGMGSAGKAIAGIYTFMSGRLPEGIKVLDRETRNGVEILRVEVPEARLGGMELKHPDVYLVRADYGLDGITGFVVVDRPFANLKKGVVNRVEDAKGEGVYCFV